MPQPTTNPRQDLGPAFPTALPSAGKIQTPCHRQAKYKRLATGRRNAEISTARRRIRAWQGPDMPASRPRLRRPRLRRPKLRQQNHRRPKPRQPGTGPERGQMSKWPCWLSPSASPSAAARVMPIARAAPAARRVRAGRQAQGPNTSFAMHGFSGRTSMPAWRICVSRRHCGPGSCRARSFDRRPPD